MTSYTDVKATYAMSAAHNACRLRVVVVYELLDL